MELRAHLDWAQEECRFIGDLLHEQGMGRILQSCLDLGQDGLEELAEEYDLPIEGFFRTPREDRADFLTDFPNELVHHGFLVAVYHRARCALAFHESLFHSGVSRWPSEDMGNMLLQFAEAQQHIAESNTPLYPFSEENVFGMSQKYFGRLG